VQFDKGLAFGIIFDIVLLIVLVWLMMGLYPPDTVSVKILKIDYFDDTMTFEYNGEQWFVRYPEYRIPPDNTGIRVEFREGKPAFIWVHRTGIMHYQNIWEKVAVLEAKKIGKIGIKNGG